MTNASLNCDVCSVVQKHVSAGIVYEDAVSVAYLSPDPAAVGHIIVVPKQHAETIEELPDAVAVQLFFVAGYAASAVYEGLASHGTNIICNNGSGAGAKSHIVVQVIPRKENDALSFVWEPKHLGPDEFDDIVRKIKDKTDFIDVKKEIKKEGAPIVAASSPKIIPSSETSATASGEKEVITKGEEENYMIKHLYRVP